jgi:glycosyltransferase involved in cell wall biosynthesis
VDPYLFVAREDALEAAEFFRTDLLRDGTSHNKPFPGKNIFVLPVTQEAWLSSPRGFSRLMKCYFELTRMKLPEIDLVHSLEAYPTGLVSHWLTRQISSHPPLISTCHGTYGILAYAHRLDRIAYRNILQHTNAICTVSQATAGQIQKYFGSVLKRSQVIPILNGNKAFEKVSREAAFGRNPQNKTVLLSVGDVKPRKGQDISLAAFARIKKQFPQAEYWIVGDPHSTSEFSQQLHVTIQRENIQDVKFLGRVSDEELEKCYQQASIFILTPRQVGLNFEGFGLVYLEAGAYGLPVIATRSGGVPEAVKDAETGLLANEEDVEGVAQAISTILADPELASRLGKANRLWSETLTWERAAEKYLQVYHSVLGDP